MPVSYTIIPEINEMFAKSVPARQWSGYRCEIAEYDKGRDATRNTRETSESDKKDKSEKEDRIEDMGVV